MLSREFLNFFKRKHHYSATYIQIPVGPRAGVQDAVALLGLRLSGPAWFLTEASVLLIVLLERDRMPQTRISAVRCLITELSLAW
jgi:hypothetical protein